MVKQKIRKNARCCGNCWWNVKGWCHNGEPKIRVNKTFVCDFKGANGFKRKD